MQVLDLKWSHFRNLNEGFITPCERMNVICGENAQGKTNLIEAIWFFTGAKSFRNTKDGALTQNGFQKGKTELTFLSEKIEKKAKIEFSEKRTAFLNGKLLNSPSKLAGNFEAVVFSPSDLSLIKGSPEERRRFLDLGVGQLYPAYIDILHRYSRALIQRNKTLKEYRYDGSLAVLLDVFEEELAEAGAIIIKKRREFLENLEKFLPTLYGELTAGREKLNFSYVCSTEPENLKEQLQKSRKEDLLTGVTSLGPHRDDLIFSINGLLARGYGSQGQQRSIALSLKLSLAQVLAEQTGEYPVCLLDDVMSELDPNRQNYVLNHICQHQCFLTCCDPANIGGLQSGKIFWVKNGEVSESCLSISATKR